MPVLIEKWFFGAVGVLQVMVWTTYNLMYRYLTTIAVLDVAPASTVNTVPVIHL